MYSYLFKGSSLITVLHKLCIKSTALCSGSVKPHQRGVMATRRKFRPGLSCKRNKCQYSSRWEDLSHLYVIGSNCVHLKNTYRTLSAQSCLNSALSPGNSFTAQLLCSCVLCKVFNTLQVQYAKTAASIISTLTPFIRSSTISAPGNFRRRSQQEVARAPPPPFHPFTLHLVGSASLAHDTSVPREGMI